MIEPVVVPFIWLILFLLVVVQDADKEETVITINEPKIVFPSPPGLS